MGLADGLATYGYAKSQPTALFDSFGLATFVGFNRDQKIQMEAALNKAVSTLSSCRSCTDCGPGNEYEDYCIDEFEKSSIVAALSAATFELHPRIIYPDGTIVLGEHRGGNHVVITPDGLNANHCALALPSLLSHEVGHYVLGGEEAHRRLYFMESRCFNCKIAPGW